MGEMYLESVEKRLREVVTGRKWNRFYVKFEQEL